MMDFLGNIKEIYLNLMKKHLQTKNGIAIDLNQLVRKMVLEHQIL
jgi:hypothetical protein